MPARTTRAGMGVNTDVIAAPYAPPACATGSGDGRTRSRRAAPGGSHQFQLPNSETTAGTSSARMTVASIRIPAASPVARIFTSVSGPDAIDAKARNRIRAALVTSRPVRARPKTTASSVSPVWSYSSQLHELLAKLAASLEK